MNQQLFFKTLSFLLKNDEVRNFHTTIDQTSVLNFTSFYMEIVEMDNIFLQSSTKRKIWALEKHFTNEVKPLLQETIVNINQLDINVQIKYNINTETILYVQDLGQKLHNNMAVLNNYNYNIESLGPTHMTFLENTASFLNYLSSLNAI